MKKIILIFALFNIYSLNAQVDLEEGLVASYLFSGDTQDSSGNGNHSFLLGNATLNEVLSCGDNSFDGVSLPHTVLDGLNDFSVCLDVKFDLFHGSINEAGKTNIIVSGWQKEGVIAPDNELNIDYLKHGYSDGESVENSIRVFIDNQRYSFYNVDLEAGVWYNLIVTRASGVLDLYLNGEIMGSLNASAVPLSIAKNGLVIGQEQDNLAGGFATHQCLAGHIDNFCIYDRAINLEEVEEVFGNSRGDLLSSIKSISELSLNSAFSLFPNPYNKESGKLNIRNDQQLKIDNIEVYDVLGKLININTINSDASLISFDPLGQNKDFQSPILMINLVLNDGTKVMYKILVQGK